MKKNTITKITALILAGTMLLGTAGCAAKVKANDLMEGIEPKEVEITADLDEGKEKITDFAVRLFQSSCVDGENTLISPLSAIYALAMTANGAKNETLTEMENVSGISTEELNQYLYSYAQNLPQGEKYKLNLANSIWFKDDENFDVNQEFLQVNADYYGADIYSDDFSESTCRDINNWVKNKTDEMIPEILDEMSKDAVMYLINALAFEAEWAVIYEKNDVHDRTFTTENGTKQDVELMYSEESIYLEDEQATGFVKYYSGRQYAFVGLLPKEGVTVAEYVDSLTGEKIQELFANKENTSVDVAIPKFELEYDTELSEVLRGMGMVSAFDSENADFTGIGTAVTSNPWDGNIYINRILHKTFISVAEKGTKAGAATVVEANCDSAAPIGEKPKVYLDRPFVYMLIDCENNIPIFIGAEMSVQ